MSSGGDCASAVISVKSTPASVERWTARPLDGPSGVTSPYCIEPPIQTVSGCPGGEATHISYQHWPVQKLYEAKPGVPGVGFESWIQPGLVTPSVSVEAGTFALSTR